MKKKTILGIFLMLVFLVTLGGCISLGGSPCSSCNGKGYTSEMRGGYEIKKNCGTCLGTGL